MKSPRLAEFYLGTHQPHWLRQYPISFCVSRRRLQGRKTYPVALAPWFLDSGAFTEITMHGKWETTPKQYATEVREYAEHIGMPCLVGPQDWMCEPFVLEKTGRSIQQHQQLTTENYLTLMSLNVPNVIPVLQGWTIDDYLRHIDNYSFHGIDLSKLPRVGIGSVCRRQGTKEIVQVLKTLAGLGLLLHGFGVKLTGLLQTAGALVSADSMAWSFAARRTNPLPGCIGHKNCANCPHYAMMWREKLLAIA